MALMFISFAGHALAQAASPDATMWLHRMSQASRTLNYSGLFVYESGGRTESSRITHIVDGSGQQERLETVDASREVIRNNDEVQTFFPKERLLVIDRAVAGSFLGALYRW